MDVIRRLVNLWAECRLVGSPYLVVLLRHLTFLLRHKNIVASTSVTIHGLQNISTGGLLRIGLSHFGFMSRHDRTFLNVGGKAIFTRDFSIAKGCRFDIGEDAVASFGAGSVGPNTHFIIMHGITIGDGCAISWGCHFLDDDFHAISYPGRTVGGSPKIEIGEHVWIGSNVSVLKGAAIPDGCVVASGSVVTKRFDHKNALIAGNPARVVREGVSWE